jgi:biotin/methionine sulfoxide reductase
MHASEPKGTFTAVVEDGRVVDCEPFRDGTAPSPIINSIPAMVHSPLRISRLAVREGWKEVSPRTGRDRFTEDSWDKALDLVASELRRVRDKLGAEGVF